MRNPAARARSGSSVTRVPSTRGRSSRVRPASCAVIITAVRAEVATNPNIAHPNQSTTSPVRLVDCRWTEGSAGHLWGGGRPGEKKSTAAIADTGRALPRVHEPRRTSWRIPHHLERSAQVYRNTTYLVQCRSSQRTTEDGSHAARDDGRRAGGRTVDEGGFRGVGPFPF